MFPLPPMGPPELHGMVGKRCPLCKHRFVKGQVLLSTEEGGWRHQFCLDVVASNDEPQRTAERAQLKLADDV